MRLALTELVARATSLAASVQRLEEDGRYERADREERRRLRAVRAIEARRAAAAENRERLIGAQLDDFDDVPDAAIEQFGGVVRYTGGLRIVGLAPAQAFRQYSRVKKALLNQCIPNERAERVARDVWLTVAGVPTKTYYPNGRVA